MEALAEAHHHQILHRDLKPENIRITAYMGDQWFAKLLDFGIARFIDPQDASVTRTGELLGTPRYMSPEQLLSEELTAASDLYSLGLVALEMWKGREALQGNQLHDQFDRLRSGHVFAVTETVDDVRLLSVIQSMTERDREKRPQSVVAVLAMLDATVQPPPPSVVPGRAPRRVEAELAPPPAGDISMTRAVGLLVAVFIAVLAIGAFVLIDDTPPPEAVSRPVLVQPAVVTAAPPDEQVPPVPDVGSGDASRVAGASDGCNLEVQTGQLLDRQERPRLLGPRKRYWVYFPSSYDPSDRHPVILLLHSRLRNGKRVFEDSQIQAQADKHRYVIIAPTDESREGWLRDDFLIDALAITHKEACLDLHRVFVVGEREAGAFARTLPCSMPLAGVATIGTGTLTKPKSATCDTPIPMLQLVGTKSRYIPVKGGQGCLGGDYEELRTVEQNWRGRNSCAGERTMWSKHKSQPCYTWECEAPFVSCHMSGGDGWPNSPQERFEMPGCPSPPASFPAPESITKFFNKLPSSPKAVAVSSEVR